MTIDWSLIGSIAAVLTIVMFVISLRGLASRGRDKLERAAGYWRRKTLQTSTYIKRNAVVVYDGVNNRLSGVKQILALRWIVWRKRVKVNIQNVIKQDEGLREASASDNERIGMAAIMLADVLGNDRTVHDETCRKVFTCIRDTDPTRFHMLCARIADDIVTNSEASIPDAGLNYIVPWDSVLEQFLKDALDEPSPETLQED